MNYYNPYFFTAPMAADTIKTGLFSRLFGGLTFSKILNGTQRALTFANQAIPFVKQVRPIIGNAKTMFRVMNEFKRTENPKNNVSQNNSFANNNMNNNTEKNTRENYDLGPTFFI